MVSLGNYTKCLKKNWYQFDIIFPENRRVRNTPSLFYEVSITLLPKPDKYIIKKTTSHQYPYEYRYKNP